jgi:hypothetical protein
MLRVLLGLIEDPLRCARVDSLVFLQLAGMRQRAGVHLLNKKAGQR